jgi:hypothetical protein
MMPTGSVTYGEETNDVLTQMFAHEHAVCENSKLSVPKESEQ